MEVLIGARVVQGLGVGGLTALVQVVIASMVSPRERGRYAGYIGATFALATVSGPLIGGLIVDSPARLARLLLRRPPGRGRGVRRAPGQAAPAGRTRPVQIDYLGATLLVAGVSILLVWVSLAGQQFDWTSPTSAVMVAVGLAVIAAAIYVEARVAVEPMIPLRLFRDRTTTLATAASVLIGVAMFGATVYLSQYFQLARGMSPTEAGLMSVAMVGGLLVSSIVTGRIITDTGLWKRYLVGGMVLVVVGLALLGTIDATTPLVGSARSWRVLGLGLGATMQNLVLAVQNNTAQSDMGAASSVVAFFRSMGGSIGVSALGALLSHQVAEKVTDGLAALGIQGGHSTGAIPDLGHAAGAGPRALRGRLRRGHRPPVPGRGAVRRARAGLRPVHPRGAAAHHARPRGGRDRHNGPVQVERQDRGGRPMTSRAESLRQLEREVGVLIRRIRRVIHERARAVHPDLQPASYLCSSWLADEGPVRASAIAEQLRHRQGRDQPPGPAPRRPRAGRAHARTPPTAGPRWSPPATTPYAGSRMSPRTAASSSTSSSATGPRTELGDVRRRRSAATTRRSTPEPGCPARRRAEPDRGVRRQQPVRRRARRWRCTTSPAGQLDGVRAAVEHHGERAAANASTSRAGVEQLDRRSAVSPRARAGRPAPRR